MPLARPLPARLAEPNTARRGPPMAPVTPHGPTNSLDSLRGLAALCVVFTHVLSLGPELAPEVLRLLDATPLRVVHTGRAPVIFFFVLSGYVLALSLLRPDAPGPLAFALRRTLRLLPPVGGAVLLSAGLCALFYRGPLLDLGWDLRHLWAEPVGPAMVARQALLIGADYWFTLDIPLWSLVHEWRLSLVFPLVLLFRGRVALLLAAALALHAAAVAAGVPPGAAQLGPRLPSTLLTSAYFALPFAAGAALALGGARLALRPGPARWAAWAGVVLAAALPWDLGTVAASAALIVLARGPGRLPRALATPALLWLGRVSFSLYLVHMPVLAAAVHATHGLISPWVALAAGVPVSLLAAAGFCAWVEAPAHRLSRLVGGERGGAAAAAPGARGWVPHGLRNAWRACSAALTTPRGSPALGLSRSVIAVLARLRRATAMPRAARRPAPSPATARWEPTWAAEGGLCLDAAATVHRRRVDSPSRDSGRRRRRAAAPPRHAAARREPAWAGEGGLFLEAAGS